MPSGSVLNDRRPPPRWLRPYAGSCATSTRARVTCAIWRARSRRCTAGLYPLLLETIARDSEKHATILRYLLHRIEEPAQR